MNAANIAKMALKTGQGLAASWLKAECANFRMNPIHVFPAEDPRKGKAIILSHMKKM